MQDPDNREDYLSTAAIKPSNLLQGATPRLIDEWQDAPVLWDAVRTMCDKRGLPGQFILTGSNSVDEKQIHHSGTGRISPMQMLPMSLWESRESNGCISLRDLFDHPRQEVEGTSDMSVNDLIFAACRGGWPAAMHAKTPSAQLITAMDYVQSVCKRDISHVDGVKRNEKLALQILRSYARNISTIAKATTMLADVVLHLGDGRYALIECKLGSVEIEEGASHLCELHRLITEHNKVEKQMPIREPDLKIILTGGEFAYTRPDGVHVVPIGCLKP